MRIVGLKLWAILFSVSIYLALRYHRPKTPISATISVPCRDDLAKFAQDYFAFKNRAIEIGVLEGVFAEKNLKHWKGKYFMVDVWGYRPNDAEKGMLQFYSAMKIMCMRFSG